MEQFPDRFTRNFMMLGTFYGTTEAAVYALYMLSNEQPKNIFKDLTDEEFDEISKQLVSLMTDKKPGEQDD